jgi:hypothetical protein
LPFTAENLEQLFSTCSNPADRKTFFLVIKNEGTDESPRSITNHACKILRKSKALLGTFVITTTPKNASERDKPSRSYMLG